VKTVSLGRTSIRRKLHLICRNLNLDRLLLLERHLAQFYETLNMIDALHRGTVFTIISKFFMLNLIL